jgi:hypothetical protein
MGHLVLVNADLFRTAFGAPLYPVAPGDARG